MTEMMKESKTDSWDVAKFESWLRVGIESYVLENAGAAAFPEAAHFFLRSGSLSVGMEAFVSQLKTKRLDAFKQALANVLSSLEPRPEYFPVAEQLLLIAGSTAAYPILNVLARKIGDGFFGQPVEGQLEEDSRSLFAMSLFTVNRLATPGRPDALRCLKSLISSQNFMPCHAAAVLIGLCQIEPHNLIDHLNDLQLRSLLLQQFKQTQNRQTLEQRLALKIIDTLGMSNYLSALKRLNIYDPDRLISNQSDNWLIDSLLYCEPPVFEHTFVDGRYGLKCLLDGKIIIEFDRPYDDGSSEVSGDTPYQFVGREAASYENISGLSKKQLEHNSICSARQLFPTWDDHVE